MPQHNRNPVQCSQGNIDQKFISASVNDPVIRPPCQKGA